MKTQARACSTCSAFHRINEQLGTCRAKPPLGFPSMQMNPVAQRPEMRVLGGWPPVSHDDWCRDDWRPANAN